jgi:hypothetical protein
VAIHSTFLALESNNRTWAWLLGFTAALFNPLIPVRLDRETWAILDVAAAALLLTSIYFVRQRTPAKREASM